MESKKINQLATAVNPSTSDLAIIGDPVTGVSKKITWLQVSTLIGTAANLQQVTDNGATTTNPVTIGGLTITGLSTGVLKSDSGVISSVPFGAANGVATLAGDGKVPSSQLPSYVDDVVEVANYAALPVTGETGKIYITLDNNKVYRWGGSVYVEIAANNAIWGSITGTLANQTDLQNALDAKANDSAVVHLAGTETITGTKTFSNPSKNDGGILLKNGASYSLSGYMNLGGMTDGLRFTSGGGVSNFFTLPSSVGYTYTFPALSGTIVAISGGNSTQYIDGTGALQTFPTLLSSDNLVKLVRNQSGATMTAGTIVYISGATGNKPLITKAIATGDSTSAQTYGLVQANIANNADGYVVIIGNVTDIDTSALTEGQQLYLSGTTAGAYTTTKPYAPIHLVYVGIVLRSHPTQGIIGVKIQNGYELDELHDVSAQSPANNDGIFFNISTSLWEKKSIATALGLTPISLASLSAVSPLIYNNGTGAFSIQVATASQNGYLSSTDFSTFNNKQAALGGTGFVKITGSTISYDNSTYYLASNPSAFITLASLSAGAGISYSNTTGVISSTITQYTDALARAAISSSATGLTYTSATGVFSLTAGYAIPTTAKQTEWDTAYTNRITSLTTTGSSGAATLVSNTLNVPTYTLSGLGGQPLDADLTAIAGLTGTSGFLKKNAADTWSLDTNTYVTTTTAQTISGAKTFSASPIIDSGLATAIPLRFKQYDSASFNSDGYTDLYVMNAYRFGFAFNQGSSNYKGFTFNVNGITLNTSREYTMPDAAGTLALTSDIPSLANYVTLNGTQTISGNKTFSGINSFTGYTSFSYASTFMNGTSLNWTAAGSHTAGSLTLSSAHSGSTSSLILSDGDTAKYIYFSFTNTATGIKTYTLPDTSGTIALTSNLSSYVPYTGATAQLNMGDNGILVGTTTAANNIRVLCSSGNGLTAETAGCKLMLEPQSLILTDKQFSNFTKTLIFRAGGLSASYTLTLPDATGTIALTSDIPSLTGYVTLATNQTITGEKTFTKSIISTSNATSNGSILISTASGVQMIPYVGGTSESAEIGLYYNAIKATNQSAITGYTNAAHLFRTEFAATSGTLLRVNNLNSTKFTIDYAGNVSAAGLVGTGTRMVVTDASGNLSAQAIPASGISGGGSQNYIAKFDSAGGTSISNSTLKDDGSRVDFLGAGTTLSGGWTANQMNRSIYPVIAFNSTATPDRYAGIGYEAGSGSGMWFWVNSTTLNGITTSTTSVLKLNNDRSVDMFGTLRVAGQYISAGLSTGGEVFATNTSGTNANFSTWTNTGGTQYVGVENSTGGTIVTGSTGYDLILRGKTGIGFSSNDGAGIALRLGSSNSARFFGTLTTGDAFFLGNAGAGGGVWTWDSTAGYIYSPTGKALWLSSNGSFGTQGIHIATNNNVTIGGTDASQKLRVNGSLYSTSSIVQSANATGEIGYFRGSNFGMAYGTNSNGAYLLSSYWVTGATSNIDLQTTTSAGAQDSRALIEYTTMTGGWNRVLNLKGEFPVLSLQSTNSTKWGGIGYDSSGSGNLVFWGGASSSNLTTGQVLAAVKNNGEWTLPTGSANWKINIEETTNKGGENGIAIRSGYYPALKFQGYNGIATTSKIVINTFATGYGGDSLGGSFLLQSDNSIQFSTGGDYVRMTLATTGNMLINHVSENSFGSTTRSIQINGAGGSLLETRYNGTSGLRLGSGSDHSYHHDPRNVEMRFATSDSTRFYIYGNGNYSFTGSNVSDRRAKDNISLLDITATDKIMSLEAKTYNMKNNPSQKRYGFIAQEVKQIVSDLVSGNENDGYLGLDYDGLLTLAIKALQEQQKEIQILKQK